MDIRPIGNATQAAPVFEKPIFGAGQAAAAPARPAAPVETAVAVQQPAQAPNLKDVEHAVHAINATMRAMSQNLEFSIDKDSNRPIIKIVDTETKEVIRQLPTEEALEIAKALDKVEGLLIRQKA